MREALLPRGGQVVPQVGGGGGGDQTSEDLQDREVVLRRASSKKHVHTLSVSSLVLRGQGERTRRRSGEV